MVTLNLTDAQAFSLRMVLDRIGGDIRRSRRLHTHAIYEQLIKQGIGYNDAIAETYLEGELYFRRESTLTDPLPEVHPDNTNTNTNNPGA